MRKTIFISCGHRLGAQAVRKLIVGSFIALFVACGARPQTEPVPAPHNSVLVKGRCAVARLKGGSLDENHAGRSFHTLSCESFDEGIAKQFLIPGEYRVYLHLIDAKNEYIVSCLGHIKYSGWAGHYHLSKDCAIPGRQSKNVITSSDPLEMGHADYPMPEPGTYLDSLWSKDRKLFVIAGFDLSYKERSGPFKYEVLRKSTTDSKILPSGTVVEGPYSCPNGEYLIKGVRKCRPTE